MTLEQVGRFHDVVVDAHEDQILELHAHPPWTASAFRASYLTQASG
jgi:hypothetical protein